MANLKASIKGLRQSKRRAAQNLKVRTRAKKSVKTFTQAIEGKDGDRASKLLNKVYKSLDKAAKKGILKKGTAARRKSRLAKKLNKLTAPDVQNTGPNA